MLSWKLHSWAAAFQNPRFWNSQTAISPRRNFLLAASCSQVANGPPTYELGANTPHPGGDLFSVMIWDYASHLKLAQLDFISDGTNNWQWLSLPEPIELTSGSQYISLFATSGYYYFGIAPTALKPTGDVQYLDMRYANSATSATFPTNVLANYQYGVPDFGYLLTPDPGGVPEPGSWSLALLGGAALLVRRVLPRRPSAARPTL